MRKYNYRTQMWEEVSEEKEPLRQRIAKGLRNAASFVQENREAIVVLVPVGMSFVGGLVKVTKWATRLYTDSHEMKVTNRRCYDTSAGHYWNLKRTLTNADWLRIQDRMSRGEKLGYILADMNVLKK